MDELSSLGRYRFNRLKMLFSSQWVKLIILVVLTLGTLSLIAVISQSLGILTVDGKLIGYCYLLMAIAFCLVNLYYFAIYGYSRQHQLDSAAGLTQIIDCTNDEAWEFAVVAARMNLLHQLPIWSTWGFILALGKLEMGKFFMVRSGFALPDKTEQSLLTNIDNKNITDKSEISVWQQAKEYALGKKRQEIVFADLIYAIYKSNTFFNHCITDLDIKENDLENILSWTERTFNENKFVYFWNKPGKPAGLAQEWSYGYALALAKYGNEVSNFTDNKALKYQTSAWRNMIDSVAGILAKSGKTNVILVGDPGIGKKTIVNCLAGLIAEGESYPSLNYKHVIQSDIGKLLAGVSNGGDLEKRFQDVFTEVKEAGNVILFVNDIANLSSAYNGEIGTVDATGLLMPYLQSERVQVIASISVEDYKNKLQTNPNFDALFNKVEVKELNKEEVLLGLEYSISHIENKYHLVFTYQAVRHLIDLAERYIHDEPFPQKAIDLLTELPTKASSQGKKVIFVNDVDAFIQERLSIPVGEVKQEEQQKLLNLESFLHQRVIGQDEAITAIANALRRSRAGLTDKHRPIGSFLFIGPTGVGKTETAKALAEAYFGSDNNMIRFDMSEFQEISSMGILIGSGSGKSFVPGRLTQGVKNNPYTIVLLDELEKAHSNILNLFLQLLDDGRLTDAAGRTVDFTNTIIIATSNAGSEQIRQYLGQKLSAEVIKKKILDYILQQNIFRPELVNRFDRVVFFKPLTLEEIGEVAKHMIYDVNKVLEEKKIEIDLSPAAMQKIASEGYDPVFGARPMRRLIQEKVEDVIAKKIISGEVKQGGVITLGESDV